MDFRPSNHIAINVKDYENAISFYRDVLRWELLKYTPVESKFKKGDRFYYIADAANQPYATFFEYEVDDINEARRLLEEKGCSIREEYSPGSIMFTDPYGMHFHVYEKGTSLPELT